MKGRHYKIFVSSPSDVRPERAVAERVIARLARDFAHHCCITPLLWEHEPLLANRHFQDFENISPPSSADICVTILWSSLGILLPPENFRGPISGREVTGTEWEFEDALKSLRERGRPELLVYQKTADVVVSLSDEAALENLRRQKHAVADFFSRWFKSADGRGFTAASHVFGTTAEFEVRLEEHVRALLLRRLAHDMGLEADLGAITWTGAPWPALAPFGLEQAPVFCGRAKARHEVRELLASQIKAGTAFVLVMGASGAGKSSLVHAGLLPDLMLPGMVGQVALVRHGTLRPSDAAADPVRALVAAIMSETALPELAALQYGADTLAAQLRQNPDQVAFAVRQGLARAAGDTLTPLGQARLVVVADQLEELFTIEPISQREREIFVAALAALARSGLVWVLATLRADFFACLESLPALAQLSDGGRYLLLPPSFAELSEIVGKPARAAGLRFEVGEASGEGLDSTIVSAAARDAGALPLLSFALDALWREPREGNTLSFAAYARLGGLEGAIANHAEAVVSALPEAAQAALPAVLLGVVSIREGEQLATGRPGLRRDLARSPEAGVVIDRLVEARLLIADETQDGTAVRLAHEALLRRWPRLAGLIEGSRESLAALTRLRSDFSEWERHGKPADLLLPRGKRLSEGVELLESELYPVEAPLKKFIRASADAVFASRRRRQRLTAGAFAALCLLTVAAGTGAWFGFSGQLAAEASRNAAQHQSEIAERSRAQILALLLKSEPDPGAAEAVALNLLGRRVNAGAGRDSPLLARLLLAANAKTQRMVLAGHGNAPVFAAFSPDGTRIVTASLDKKVCIWDAATGALLTTLSGHTDQVESAVYSRDGKRILTSSDDRTAIVWDAASGRKLLTLAGHEKGLYGASFSADGTRIATASDDNTARIWDASTGAMLATLSGHRGSVSTANFSPDGRLVVTASVDATARIWDAATGAPLKVLTGHGSYVENAAFSPDGTRIVTASLDKTARIWDSATGALLRTISAPAGLAFAAYSPDGSRIATASANKMVYLWDAGSGALLATLVGHQSVVVSAAFSPDGRRLATTSLDKTVRVWDATANLPLLVLSGHRDEPVKAVFSPDGQIVLTGSMDQTARLWNAGNGALIRTLDDTMGAVLGVNFSPDGKRIATACLNAMARIWNMADGTRERAFSIPGVQVQSVAFSPDGRFLVVATNDNIARIFDAGSGALVMRLSGHTGWVRNAVFSPDQNRILTSSVDGTARLWDSRTGSPIVTMRGHGADVVDAAFSRDGSRIVTASTDRTARIWEAGTGNLLHVLAGHEAGVRSAGFSPDGQRIVTASGDGTVRIWSATSFAPLISLSANGAIFRDAAFSPDGRRIVTTSGDKLVRIWAVGNYLDAGDIAFIRATSSHLLDSTLRAQYGLEPPLPGILRASANPACAAAEGEHTASPDRWTAGAASGDGACHQRLAEFYETGPGAPRDLGRAFFHHAVAARIFEAQGRDEAAQEESYRREALAWTLPRETASRLMDAADDWSAGQAFPPSDAHLAAKHATAGPRLAGDPQPR